MIREAATDAEVSVTFPVMRQLRPHLEEEGYLGLVSRLRSSGYRLAFSAEGGEVRCVDDLVTAEDARSEEHGKRMLDWLVGVAREEACSSLQLDSGVQRHEAHRFYFREGMKISSYHFSMAL